MSLFDRIMLTESKASFTVAKDNWRGNTRKNMLQGLTDYRVRFGTMFNKAPKSVKPVAKVRRLLDKLVQADKELSAWVYKEFNDGVSVDLSAVGWKNHFEQHPPAAGASKPDWVSDSAWPK